MPFCYVPYPHSYIFLVFLLSLRGTCGSVKCKVKHQVDGSRYLHFVSDFPQLIKCLRNGLLKCPFNTPDGHISHFLLPFRKKGTCL